MKDVKLRLFHPDWTMVANDIYVRGAAFQAGKLLRNDTLAAYLKTHSSLDQLPAEVSRLNGYFSAIVIRETHLCAIVDKLRSMPLFYCVNDEQLYLSDNAEWIRQSLGVSQLDQTATDELALVGYVTGRASLFCEISQVQAGEVVTFLRNDMCFEKKSYRYYRDLNRETRVNYQGDYKNQLLHTLKHVVSRLVEFADDKQIAIPLSGGYDSRLILAMLKNYGYHKLFTYTYGPLGNRDSLMSQRIAETLEVPWQFVPYDDDMWKKVWSNERIMVHLLSGSGWTSLPHIQDLPAVQALLSDGSLEMNAVVVPGHGGVLAGSHLPPEAFSSKCFLKSDLVNLIMRGYFHLSPMSAASALNPEEIWSHISALLATKEVITPEDIALYVDLWEIEERQSKFIVNSVRVYDDFGLSWWLPLFDSEFMDFWTRVPLCLRKNKRWYGNFVREVFAEIAGIDPADSGGNASDTPINYLKSIAIKTGGSHRGQYARRVIYRRIREKIGMGHFEDPLLELSAFDGQETEELYRNGYRVNGVLAKHILEMMRRYLENSKECVRADGVV